MNNSGIKFIEHIKKCIDKKSVCILGFGREGRATYDIISRYCIPSRIAISDINEIDREGNDLSDNTELICGENYQDCLDEFDIVFKSPGIVLQKQPDELNCTITSETQIFFEVFREQIIGITGTKGKSTSSSLIYHILNESGIKSHLVGNIGIPVFTIAEEMTDDTVIVCELSCHQLEYMTVSPKYAVFLNLFEEHLDHYGTMERYYNAKKNIYLHQKNGDSLLINKDIAPENSDALVRTIAFDDENADICISDGKIICNYNDDVYDIPINEISLIGTHNHYNIAVAYYATAPYVNKEQFTNALATFVPLPHRLEYIGEAKNIHWYDDSISTACATAIEALKSVPNVKTIIIGGMDRGIDYAPLVDFLRKTNVNVVCMEASGRRIYEMMIKSNFRTLRIKYVLHLKEAVYIASSITPEGMSCVMSPASASYGIFKNFEERGDAFKQYVNELRNIDKLK